jgi:hypothetical protein
MLQGLSGRFQTAVLRSSRQHDSADPLPQAAVSTVQIGGIILAVASLAGIVLLLLPAGAQPWSARSGLRRRRRDTAASPLTDQNTFFASPPLDYFDKLGEPDEALCWDSKGYQGEARTRDGRDDLCGADTEPLDGLLARASQNPGAAESRADQRKLFLPPLGLVLLAGTICFAATTAVLAWGAGEPAKHASSPSPSPNYNKSGSFGIVGLPALHVQPSGVPSSVADALNQHRAVVLLVYLAGAADDDDMLTSFTALEAKYASQAAFFSAEANDVWQLGSLLAQLRVGTPPIFAAIAGDGSVRTLYTGWISEPVMDQAAADAIRP